MDREQANAAAQALLDSELRAQDEAQRTVALQQARKARQRRMAIGGLMFAAGGAVVAYLCDQRWLYGAIVGASVGYLFGWAFTRRQTR
jgi:hypothetical protein